MRQALTTIVTVVAAIGLVAIASSTALAQQKTVKACTEEWRANKADNQAKGITEKAYVTQCRAGTAATQPPAQPTAAPARPAAPARQTAAPTGANQSASEAQAKARCGADLVVWVNTSSHIYHFSGHRDYGHTKNGTFMCERDANAAGARAAKNEKRPGA